MPTLSPYILRDSRSRSFVTCNISLRTHSQLLLDSSSWESFSDDELAQYITRGAQTLQERIQALADPGVVLDEKAVKELFFMLESLLYVKNILPLKGGDVMNGETPR